MLMSHDHEHEHHVIGYGSHTLVYIGLLFLTGLTVAAAGVDLSWSVNLTLAMVIATAKAGLVLTYFMHLKYEKPYLQAFILGVILFMFIVFCLTFVDYAARV